MNFSIKSFYAKPLLTLSLVFSASGTMLMADTTFASVAGKLASANPEAIVSELTLIAAQSSLKAEVAPADPEVEFEYLWPSSAGELNRWSVGVSQEIPDFRKMRAAGKVVKAIDNQKRFDRQALEKEARYDAEQKLIRLIGAKRDLEMLRRIHDNFDSLTVTYNRAWEKGEVTILDLNKIKIEHARASSANSQAEGEVAALVSEIISLSNGTITEEELAMLSDYPAFVTIPETADVDAVVKSSAQYKAMEEQVKVADAKVGFASKSRFPQLSLGYSHAYEDGNHFNGISAGLTLPLFSRSSEKSAAMAERLSAGESTRRGLAEMVASVKGDMARGAVLRKQLKMLAPAVENTNNFRLLKLALEGGEISLLDYLQEVSYFVEAAREYNAARLDYALVGASLARYFNGETDYLGEAEGIEVR